MKSAEDAIKSYREFRSRIEAKYRDLPVILHSDMPHDVPKDLPPSESIDLRKRRAQRACRLEKWKRAFWARHFNGITIAQRHGDKSQPHPHNQAVLRIDAISNGLWMMLEHPFKSEIDRDFARELDAHHDGAVASWDRAYFAIAKLDTLNDLCDWIDHHVCSLNPRNAAAAIFGRKENFKDVIQRGYELADELADRFRIIALPTLPPEDQIGEAQARSLLKNLKKWARDATLAVPPSGLNRRKTGPRPIFDPQQDARLRSDWEASGSTMSQFARATGRKASEVERACKRAKCRQNAHK